jgi:hypothetical protein
MLPQQRQATAAFFWDRSYGVELAGSDGSGGRGQPDVIAFDPRSKEPGRDGDADTEQDDAAESLAPLADPGTGKAAEF